MKHDSNDELQKFCDETIISLEYVNCSIFLESFPVIIPETQSNNLPQNNILNSTPNFVDANINRNQEQLNSISQIDPSNVNVTTLLLNFMKQISSKIESNYDNRDKSLLEKMSLLLNQHKKQTTPTEIKDKYYGELEKKIDKFQRLSNQLTINSSYFSNDIFPKILNNDYFPPPLYRDNDLYKEKYYNQLIFGFKKDILIFNTEYINQQLSQLMSKNQFIIDKLDEIDDNVTDKIDVLKSKIKAKYDSDLKNGMEKVNRLITTKKKHDDNQSNIQTASSNCQPNESSAVNDKNGSTNSFNKNNSKYNSYARNSNQNRSRSKSRVTYSNQSYKNIIGQNNNRFTSFKQQNYNLTRNNHYNNRNNNYSNANIFQRYSYNSANSIAQNQSNNNIHINRKN